MLWPVAFVAFNNRPGCFPHEYMEECTSWPYRQSGHGTSITPYWVRRAGVSGVEFDEETANVDEVVERRGKSQVL